MAEKQKLPCREHGGYFYRVPKRGRVPVRCTDETPCDAMNNTAPDIPRKTAARVRQETDTPKQARERRERLAQRAREEAEIAQETPGKRFPSEPKPRSQSLAKGQQAKDLLEDQGWTVTGKAWKAPVPSDVKQVPVDWASVSAARGEETLLLVWRMGQLQDQVYNLWSVDKPQSNGKPKTDLPFDPEEIPDAELARVLIGVKVTWYNRLAQKAETAICGRDSLTIEHIWTGHGEETPGARIIKFIDATKNQTAFKAFRLDQLLKVGK